MAVTYKKLFHLLIDKGIYLSLQYGKNTLDKSRLKRRFSRNTQKNKVSETSSFLWTMVTPVLTSTAPTGNE